MSSLFRMEMKVHSKNSIKDIEVQCLGRIYERFFTKDCGFFINKYRLIRYFSGENIVSGDIEEVHKKIRDEIWRMFPSFKVTTSWTNLNELPYEEFVD